MTAILSEVAIFCKDDKLHLRIHDQTSRLILLLDPRSIEKSLGSHVLFQCRFKIVKGPPLMCRRTFLLAAWSDQHGCIWGTRLVIACWWRLSAVSRIRGTVIQL